MITVQTKIQADIDKVWQMWNDPLHITKWCFASDDWECPHAENDLKEGGVFKYRMSAKDGSQGFDMEGVYTKVKPKKYIAYTFGDRTAEVSFEEMNGVTVVTESFDPENENSEELQRFGWQAILENFKKHVESN
jgi:uncharacterized protein YndB with AHSA1/START domain